jgi:hypothetical protein
VARRELVARVAGPNRARTYLQPPIANLGNMNLRCPQLNWGLDAGRWFAADFESP